MDQVCTFRQIGTYGTLSLIAMQDYNFCCSTFVVAQFLLTFLVEAGRLQSGYTLTDRRSPMAKKKLNWRKENHTLTPI